jgi:AcrR family transcriptional regulator
LLAGTVKSVATAAQDTFTPARLHPQGGRFDRLRTESAECLLEGRAMAATRGRRQWRRTRRALLGAFNSLVTRRRYETLRVGEVIREADVGWSTFYEHFRDKDHLLVESMSGLLAVLAGAATGEPGGHLAFILQHFADNAPLARELVNRPSCALVVRALAELLESRFDGRTCRGVIPISLAAHQVAESIVGQVRAWLNSGCAVPAPVAAMALARATTAMARALTAA